MADPSGANFSSGLAGVIYGAAPVPELAHLEAMLVQGVVNLIDRSTSSQIHRHGPWIDHNLLKRLSERNFLHVARRLERRAPAAIENMPTLRERKMELMRSAEMEQIFAPASLDLLIETLQMDEEMGGAM